MRAKSLKSIQSNYSVLQGLWQAVLDDNVHPEVRTRVIGVQTKMESFDFFFGISLAELVLSHGDNLSATLQSSTISATEGQHVASMTKQLLTKEKFYLFWNLVQKKAGEIDVSEPSLPRPRKVPKRFETDDAVVHFPATVEGYYHDIYFEVLDLAISSITSRFDQAGYHMYQKVKDLLIKSVLGEDFSNELESVTEFYGDDLSPYRLSPQLSILASQLIKFKEALNFQNILEYIRSISL